MIRCSGAYSLAISASSSADERTTILLFLRDSYIYPLRESSSICSFNSFCTCFAKEGDVVDRAEDGTFIRNGEPLDETAYIINGDVSGNRYGSAEFPLTVPENCVFVLGDNRPISLDSRYADIGFIQEDYLLGKAIIRVGSDWNIYE